MSEWVEYSSAEAPIEDRPHIWGNRKVKNLGQKCRKEQCPSGGVSYMRNVLSTFVTVFSPSPFLIAAKPSSVLRRWLWGTQQGREAHLLTSIPPTINSKSSSCPSSVWPWQRKKERHAHGPRSVGSEG